MQTFNTPTAIRAVLNIPAGSVRFIAADRADTTVEIVPSDDSKGRDVKAADQTTVVYDDGVLHIEMPAKNRYFSPTGSVDVTVHLPAGSHVQAKAAAAELRTTGRLGDVTFDGAHGVVTLEEAASVRLSAYVADVEIARLGGPAEISTQKGDIHVGEASHGAVVLRAQAGSIRVGAATGVAATLDAGTSSGRISNSLKNDGAATLEIHATTSYGDITAHSL
jgi:hypothetical protein